MGVYQNLQVIHAWVYEREVPELSWNKLTASRAEDDCTVSATCGLFYKYSGVSIPWRDCNIMPKDF